MLEATDIRIVRPFFNKKLVMLRYYIWVIIATAVCIASDMEFLSWVYYVLAVFIVGFLRYWFIKNLYLNSSFEFGENTIREKQNYLISLFKEIKYSNIKEVEMSKGLFQKYFGLGNLILHTQASSRDGNEDSGLSLCDISNIEDVYHLVKEKLNYK